MLRQRIVTAVVLVATLIAALLWLPADAFDFLMLLVIALAGWEWSALAGLQSLVARSVCVAGLLVSCVLLFLLPAFWLERFLFMAVVWWPLALIGIVKHKQFSVLMRNTMVALLIGWLVLVSSWVSLYWVQRLPGGRVYNVLWCIALVAAADIGAYFAGRTLGRRKLAPAVSPHKTWEGAVGGVLATWIVTVVGARWHPGNLFEDANLIVTTLAAVWLAAYSVVGDLLESLLKRTRQLKDSGSLLPGHGGIMDRLDSLTAVFPLFVWMLLQMGAMPV